MPMVEKRRAAEDGESERSACAKCEPLAVVGEAAFRAIMVAKYSPVRNIDRSANWHRFCVDEQRDSRQR